MANPQILEEVEWQNLIEKMIDLSVEQTQGWGLGEYGFLPFNAHLQAQFEEMIQQMQPDLGVQHE